MLAAISLVQHRFHKDRDGGSIFSSIIVNVTTEAKKQHQSASSFNTRYVGYTRTKHNTAIIIGGIARLKFS